MAKHEKTLPARRQRGVDESLLIRSAESLGRMIGSLQRQLDGATKVTKVLTGAGSASKATMDGNEAHTRQGTRKAAAVRPARAARSGGKGTGPSGATKVKSTADRKSKRASKSAAAKKSGGRSRSGASRRSAKATRRT
jgi:hypothetical protein